MSTLVGDVRGLAYLGLNAADLDAWEPLFSLDFFRKRRGIGMLKPGDQAPNFILAVLEGGRFELFEELKERIEVVVARFDDLRGTTDWSQLGMEVN